MIVRCAILLSRPDSNIRLPTIALTIFYAIQHQQQVAGAVERAKQVTMTELNHIIGVRWMNVPNTVTSLTVLITQAQQLQAQNHMPPHPPLPLPGHPGVLPHPPHLPTSSAGLLALSQAALTGHPHPLAVVKEELRNNEQAHAAQSTLPHTMLKHGDLLGLFKYQWSIISHSHNSGRRTRKRTGARKSQRTGAGAGKSTGLWLLHIYGHTHGYLVYEFS